DGKVADLATDFRFLGFVGGLKPTLRAGVMFRAARCDAADWTWLSHCGLRESSHPVGRALARRRPPPGATGRAARVEMHAPRAGAFPQMPIRYGGAGAMARRVGGWRCAYP